MVKKNGEKKEKIKRTPTIIKENYTKNNSYSFHNNKNWNKKENKKLNYLKKETIFKRSFSMWKKNKMNKLEHWETETLSSFVFEN